MAQTNEATSLLYKYKRFDHRILELLITDRLYFADPTNFNDPLDTRPSVDSDLDHPALKEVFRRLVEQRSLAEMTAAANSIKYRGPRTVTHIEEESRRHAARLVQDIEYNATNPAYEMDDPMGFLLTSEIGAELLMRYNKGIVSFAGRADCPLMWSHYGDQHNGICIGYSIPPNRSVDVGDVNYGGSRLVRASDIARMLDGEQESQSRVDQAVLFTKAKPWEYEHERRLIGERGLRGSPLELEEVIFGLRCPETVKYTVVKALDGRSRPVKFYEMRELPGTFELKMCEPELEEALARWPLRSLSLMESFDSFIGNAEQETGQP